MAPQALALLNNDFVHAQSDALAERVVREAGADAPRRSSVPGGWLCRVRRPAAEREFAVDHLAQQRERFAGASSQPSAARRRAGP